MDSNNIFFKVIVGVVLVGYMAFIFYQSLKGGIAYKKEFENFKNSHKHYETMVDGGYWVWVMVAMAVVAFVLMFMAPKLASNGQTYYYYLAYGCIGLVFLGLSIDSYTHRRVYFTEDGFFFEDTYYRYRMLANFEFKNGVITHNCTVLMSNRDKIVVTKKIGEKLQEKQKAFKKAKKVINNVVFIRFRWNFNEFKWNYYRRRREFNISMDTKTFIWICDRKRSCFLYGTCF